VHLLQEASGVKADVVYAAPRPGDVRDSLADVSAARSQLGYHPTVEFESGLREYMTWLKQELKV
jgi:nucleoside-diphosphate-sugar epimerase